MSEDKFPSDNPNSVFAAEVLELALRGKSKDREGDLRDYPEDPDKQYELDRRAATRILDAVSLAEEVDARIEEAGCDGLTGLPNRKKVIEFIEKGLSKQPDSEERRDPAADAITVYFIDLNDFKEINDKYGHAAGDEILKSVGDRLGGLIRKDIDMAGRLGGDEFVVVAAGSYSNILMRRIREAIEGTTIDYMSDGGEVSLSVTCSIGAHDSTEASTVEELISGADGAMYENKNSTKRRVV